MIHSKEAEKQPVKEKNRLCTGSEILLKALASEGVDVIFGYPAEPFCRLMMKYTAWNEPYSR